MDMKRRRRKGRNPLFRKRWFDDDTIIQCVNWYLRFKLSYRDLALMMGQLGVSVAPCTILRWVVRYSIDFAEPCVRSKSPWAGHGVATRPTSWSAGNGCICTVLSMNTAKRSNLTSAEHATSQPAKAFFRKALKRHGEPRTITIDGFRPTRAALNRMGMRNEFNFRWANPVKIRCCPYLNNVVEQDHRRIKSRVQPMLGFKKFYNARRVLIGIEFMQKIHKGQFTLAAA